MDLLLHFLKKLSRCPKFWQNIWIPSCYSNTASGKEQSDSNMNPTRIWNHILQGLYIKSFFRSPSQNLICFLESDEFYFGGFPPIFFQNNWRLCEILPQHLIKFVKILTEDSRKKASRISRIWGPGKFWNRHIQSSRSTGHSGKHFLSRN